MPRGPRLAPQGTDVSGEAYKVASNMTGPLYGDACQLAAQCLGILANIIYLGWVGTVMFK
jgi:hypothetical protein